MNLKRILALLLAALLSVTLLSACGKGEDETSDPSDTSLPVDSDTASGSETQGEASATERFDYFGTDLSSYVTVDSSLYKNLSVELSSDYVVDKSDVETYVNSQLIQNRVAKNGSTKCTDKPIKQGDSAFIYYKGFLDGVAFSGGSNWEDAEPFELVIGSGSFIPGFEEGLIDLIPAETSAENPFALNVTFPTSYHSAEMAGKSVVFHVWVVYTVEYEFPAYDEAFILDTLGFVAETDDVKAEFEAYMLAQITQEMASYAESEVLNQLWDNLLAGANVLVYPESEIEYYYNSYLEQYEYYKQYYTYFGYSFETLDDFVEAYLGLAEGADWRAETRENCKTDVAQNLIFHAIAQKENIIITDSDYQESIQYYVNYYASQGATYTAEEIEAGLGADMLKEHALFTKINKLLVDNCTVTYAK